MISSYAQAIFDKLFVPDGKRFVVAFNREQLLYTQEVCAKLENTFAVQVYSGNALDLRIIREKWLEGDKDGYVLFVTYDDIELLPDVAIDVDYVVFQFRSFFPHYSWDLVKRLSFKQQEWLYEQPQLVDLNKLQTERIISDSDVVLSRKENAYRQLKSDWASNCQELDFNKPTAWMQKAAEIILSAIEMDRLGEFREDIADANSKFLSFLQESYINILSSTCGNKAPRIVTHVLPYIAKQKHEKIALVVIDGMNYWQSILLSRSLEENLNIRTKTDCIYSWLPSVTELSRQAIFRGDIPVVEYNQSPDSEKKLWREYWESKGIPAFQQYYQHSGIINEEMAIKRLGYVVVDLDNKMHASDNYMYLYDNTKRWVEEKELLQNIQHLIERGFKVYITTDHGNIETKAYKKLDSRDKLGANLSYRHITLPDIADKGMFEKDYEGHLVQIDKESRTYYAIDKESFTSKERCVTHGGTHWLEVLIPFITIEG